MDEANLARRRERDGRSGKAVLLVPNILDRAPAAGRRRAEHTRKATQINRRARRKRARAPKEASPHASRSGDACPKFAGRRSGFRPGFAGKRYSFGLPYKPVSSAAMKLSYTNRKPSSVSC